MSKVDFAGYADFVRMQTHTLLSSADGRLATPIPSCPGWSMADLLDHLTVVYRHKETAIRTTVEPQPWPPDEFPGSDPVSRLELATAELLDAFTTHDPDGACWTWNPDDQSVGFWHRRMAQEIAIHAYDGLAAVGVSRPLDLLIAADGIDELLQVFVAGDWSDLPQPGPEFDVEIQAVDTADQWYVQLVPDRILVRRDFSPPAPASVTLKGSASDLDLALWQRVPVESLVAAGDGSAAVRLLNWLKLVQG